MKFNVFGGVDWRSILSLGLATYFGEKYIAITITLGPIMYTFEIYFE